LHPDLPQLLRRRLLLFKFEQVVYPKVCLLVAVLKSPFKDALTQRLLFAQMLCESDVLLPEIIVQSKERQQTFEIQLYIVEIIA
jgi:hypothetical protein